MASLLSLRDSARKNRSDGCSGVEPVLVQGCLTALPSFIPHHDNGMLHEIEYPNPSGVTYFQDFDPHLMRRPGSVGIDGHTAPTFGDGAFATANFASERSRLKMFRLLSRREYVEDSKTLSKVVDLEARRTLQVLKKPAKIVFLMEFDFLLTRDFLSLAKKVAGLLSNSTMRLGVLFPDPLEYFYANFLKVPWITFDSSAPVEGILQLMHDDPGGSPADAFAFNSEVIVAHGESLRWLAFGNRSLELAFLAMADADAEEAWRSSASGALLTLKEAQDRLFPVLYPNNLPLALKSALRTGFLQPNQAGDRTSITQAHDRPSTEAPDT